MAERVREIIAEMREITIRGLVEALAAALGCSEGQWTLEFRLDRGKLVKAYRHHGPIAVDEVEELAI